MKIARMPYEPGALVDFYEEGLTALGALCSRTWHDRLEIVAEGPAATLWNKTGALHSVELRFGAAEDATARDAAHEVFPGCPLTFRLAEALQANPPPLDRVVLAADGPTARPPDASVAERLWRAQFPNTGQWRLRTPFTADRHFSIVALVRCEIQAIDQQWSLHRLAFSLPDGELDDGLANAIGFAQCERSSPPGLQWPACDPSALAQLLERAIKKEAASDLSTVRQRQELRLRRELERIDDYFAGYRKDLEDRARRNRRTGLNLNDRLQAADAERDRHRADQLARHEISLVPHVDSLLLVAEPAWRAQVQLTRMRQSDETIVARYIPRARRWAAEAPSS